MLLSRRLFLFPAFAPLLYNAAIILGGVLLSRRLGIASLAYGAVAGSFLGPFLINAIGAARIGTGYRVSFDMRNPAFREWVKLSIPLMLGVSLVTADDWILRYFASGAVGDITRLNYAKKLVRGADCGLGAGHQPGIAAIFCQAIWGKAAARIRRHGERFDLPHCGHVPVGYQSHDGGRAPLIDLVYRRGQFHVF